MEFVAQTNPLIRSTYLWYLWYLWSSSSLSRFQLYDDQYNFLLYGARIIGLCKDIVRLVAWSKLGQCGRVELHWMVHPELVKSILKSIHRWGRNHFSWQAIPCVNCRVREEVSVLVWVTSLLGELKSIGPGVGLTSKVHQLVWIDLTCILEHVYHISPEVPESHRWQPQLPQPLWVRYVPQFRDIRWL